MDYNLSLDYCRSNFIDDFLNSKAIGVFVDLERQEELCLIVWLRHLWRPDGTTDFLCLCSRGRLVLSL